MIYLTLNNLDQAFEKTVKPLVITNVEPDPEGEAEISRRLFSSYKSERFDPVPSCYCGEQRAFWLEGVKCSVCDYEVAAIWGESQNSATSVWFAATESVPRLMNLKVLVNIKEFFHPGAARFCPISFFISPDYRPAKETALVASLRESGFDRGYNSFCDNYIEIVDWLLGLSYYKQRTRDIVGTRDLKAFLKKSKPNTFSTHHPLPKRGMMIIEKTPTGTYKDPVSIRALDAIRLLQGLKYETRIKQEKRVAKASLMLALFHTQFMNKCVLRGKYGVARKAIFGTRTHHSCRNVIVSITEVHDMNVFKIPWASCIAMMQPHLINKMCRRGHSVMNAKRIIDFSVKVFNKEISDCIDELLSETKRGYFKITVGRNPSMGPESLHLTNATAGRDPEMEAIEASILLVKFFNSDFDGDFKNIMLTLDLKMERLLAPLESHNNLFALDDPGTITNWIHLPDPLVSTASNWLSNRKPPNKKESKDFMKSLR